ncbi:MAG: hypothetical protein GY711_26255 [bacterium]|nr:hypothetical protein [bacterium]
MRNLLLLLVCLAPACLESEESIVVSPDGTITIQVTASGDASDLADGYAVPLHGPWRASDETTSRWIRDVGRAAHAAHSYGPAAPLRPRSVPPTR